VYGQPKKLVVFVQNLVDIDAVILIMSKIFVYFASLA